MDACGVGALPDADEYGDAGSNTLGHLSERVGGLDLPTLERLGLGLDHPDRGRAARRRTPWSTGGSTRSGPGKESTTGHWELMGVVPQHALPTYPEGFPPDVIERLEEATGPPLLLQPPLQRHGGDRGLRQAPPRDRRGDPLHVRRLGAPVRRARRRAVRAGAVRGLRGGARGDERRARGRARDRAAVRGRAGQLPAPRGAARLRRAAARAARTWRSSRTPGLPVHGVGKIRDLFAGRGHHREARGRDQREGDRLGRRGCSRSSTAG